MRVGLVSFAWGSRHRGGLRSHVRDLAASLVVQGDQVFVHCVNTDPEAPMFQTRSWIEGGVHVQEMNYAYQDIRDLMGLQCVPPAEAIAVDWARRYELDLVDVQHTLFFGMRLLRILGSHLPTVATLHDYWPLDPHAQLFSAPGSGLSFSPLIWASKVEAVWPLAFRNSVEAVSYYAGSSDHELLNEPNLMRAWISYSKVCLAACQCLVTPSRASAAVYENHGICQSLKIVENGIDVPALQCGITVEPQRREWCGPRIRLGLLGNISPAKGQLSFCKACLHPELASIVQVHLYGQCPPVVQGDPEPQAQIRSLWQSHPDLFLWHGSYERADLPEIFASVDLLVMPSLWEEVYGLIAREALCYGLPLIITNAGALADLAERSRVFMLNRDEPDGWAVALLEAFHAGPLYRWVYERRERMPPVDSEVRSSTECGEEVRSLYAQVLAESSRF
jgi:glycosyltransferase involved in cell wall biosynthesis